MIKKIFLPLLAVAAFIVIAGLLVQGKLNVSDNNLLKYNTAPSPQPAKSNYQVKIGNKTVNVEIALSQEERSRGLSNRSELELNNGMLFVFNPPARPNFWMKDTNFALDFIWIKDGRITGIDKNVQPQPGNADHELTLYGAPGEVDYVLEVNGGYTDKNNINEGDPVILPSL